MDVLQQVNASLTKEVRKNISTQTNLDQATVDSVIDTGLPVLLGMLGKNTSSKSGASELSSALKNKHDGSLLSDLGRLFTGSSTKNVDGTKILGHIFGSNTSGVEKKIATQTGVDTETIVKVLSFVAPIVLAYLGKEKAQSNLDAKDLGDLLNQQSANDGGLFVDLATQFLDKDDDGQVVDDILDMFKGKK